MESLGLDGHMPRCSMLSVLLLHILELHLGYLEYRSARWNNSQDEQELKADTCVWSEPPVIVP